MAKYNSLRGMPDILPCEAELFHWVEEKAREVFKLFNFSEIRTPFLEKTEVFTRSIGADTDIVEKEMYTLETKSGKSISLRPEGTASVVRAYIEHGWNNDNDLVKLFYIGPMFRSERPQKGRLRQFHQIGAEIIGISDVCLDAELIINASKVLEGLGIKGFKILINSLGCKKDRDAYKKDLKTFLTSKASGLCDNCIKRAKTNVLRVLDCKRPSCKKIVGKAPNILDYLCGECLNYYEGVKELLRLAKVEYTEKKDLVRGLDYYTGTVFEIVHSSLGAQDAIAAGGRYDNLSGDMGGPQVGATGYAIGIERVLLLIDKKDLGSRDKSILIVAVDEKYKKEAFDLVVKLREKGIGCEMEATGRSLKSVLRKANKESRKKVVLIGEEEVSNKEFLLKDMKNGDQESLTYPKLLKALENIS